MKLNDGGFIILSRLPFHEVCTAAVILVGQPAPALLSTLPVSLYFLINLFISTCLQQAADSRHFVAHMLVVQNPPVCVWCSMTHLIGLFWGGPFWLGDVIEVNIHGWPGPSSWLLDGMGGGYAGADTCLGILLIVVAGFLAVPTLAVEPHAAHQVVLLPPAASGSSTKPTSCQCSWHTRQASLGPGQSRQEAKTHNWGTGEAVPCCLR